MDAQLAWHDRRVAEAATAWLADPWDTQVYARLVAAVHARRGYLEPQLPSKQVDVEDVGPVPPSRQPDELLDELGADRPPERAGAVAHRLSEWLRTAGGGPVET